MMPDSNTAALNQKIMSDRDESQSEAQERAGCIMLLARKKLQDVAFVCEAFSEMSEKEILAAAHYVDGIQRYALAVATKEIDG